jgi:DNA mismatch repair protein MutS
VLGYHIDISPSHVAKVPDYFIHKQSLASSHRYTTVELAELEAELMHADSASLERELVLYNELLSVLQTFEAVLKQICRTIATLDVLTSHAALAKEENYSRPIVDDSKALCITGGRHPVVEQVLRASTAQTPFAPNDCTITAQKRFWLMTGPNMGGKSTYLRQNALIVLMAQMGMYVPASSAHIGYVDRLSSRVGAFDDLAAGRSTFMVEMIETAAILHQSTDRSFVILDEIGRGTATYDGLAIALAVTEYLYHTTQCRALFATHYHELTTFTKDLPHLGCLTVAVQTFGSDIVFLHQVCEGTADRSYGVHVAARAGLPKSVVQRATTVLADLEANRGQGGVGAGQAPALKQAALNFGGNAKGAMQNVRDVPQAPGIGSVPGRGLTPFHVSDPASHSNPVPAPLQLHADGHFASVGLDVKAASDTASVRTAVLYERLMALDLNQLTPKAALDALYDLQGLLSEETSDKAA